MAWLWQSFFVGWGLLFTIVLIVSPFIVQNITWSLLDAIDMESIKQNNFDATNLRLSGTDKKGEPFLILSELALQKFSEPNVIHFVEPIAYITNEQDGEKIERRISARTGKFLQDLNRIILTTEVLVESSDGTTARANQMEIDLE